MDADDERGTVKAEGSPRDRRLRMPDWAPWALTLVLVVLAVAGAVTVVASVYAERTDNAARSAASAQQAAADAKRAIRAVEREGAERRDQACTLFEGDHKADVDRLKRTYAYLSRPARRRDPDLTDIALRQLPELEREARTDTAPDYCDEPGAAAERRGVPPIGRPEPDPRLPKRRDFSHLSKPST